MSFHYLITVLLLFGCSDSAYIPPNSTTISAAREIYHQGLNILDFYIALRDLYLTGGFAYGNPFNTAIVGQAKITEEVWTQIRYSLEQTRLELRAGDIRLRRLDNLIKLNSPDGLTYEPWLKDLSYFFAKKSVNPKIMAHSIRAIGSDLEQQNLTRTSYFNGTYLASFISDWYQKNYPEIPEDQKLKLTNGVIILHHVVGPENFDVFSEILESFPWETDCYEEVDMRMLQFFQDNIIGSVINADQAERVLRAFEMGFRNYTDTKKENKDGGIIDRLVLNDLGTPESRELKDLAPELLAIFQDALSSGLTFSDIKETLVALAKLLNNLGAQTSGKLDELQIALQDKNWQYNLDYLEGVALRLPNNSIGILNTFLNLPGYPDLVLFPDTKFVELQDMKNLLAVMKENSVENVQSMISMILNSGASRRANVFVQLMEAYTKITREHSELEVSLAHSMKLILGWTNATGNSTEYQNFLQHIIDFSNGARDSRWSDFFMVLQDLNRVFDIRPKKREAQLAPLKGLEPSGNFIEILQGYRMLLDKFQEKSKLLQDFLKLQDPMASLKQLGINPDDLERWTYSTRSIDALTDLLKATNSRENLGALLGFHGQHTTVVEASGSLELIKNIIQFMEMDGGFWMEKKKRKGSASPMDFNKLENVEWFYL